jgi:hypothetical protein
VKLRLAAAVSATLVKLSRRFNKCRIWCARDPVYSTRNLVLGLYIAAREFGCGRGARQSGQVGNGERRQARTP